LLLRYRWGIPNTLWLCSILDLLWSTVLLWLWNKSNALLRKKPNWLWWQKHWLLLILLVG
jgi:hypothetical protein